MVQVTNSEMPDMHFCCGMSSGNAEASKRIYLERFPQCAVLIVRTFIGLRARLPNTGSFKRSIVVIGRPVTVRTFQIQKVVLNEIERNSDTST